MWLGGTFGLVHADTHSVVLPHVVAFNGAGRAGYPPPPAMARLADALGRPGDDAAGALWISPRRRERGAADRRWLRPLGLAREDLYRGCRAGRRRDHRQPRPAGLAADLLDVLPAAYDGTGRSSSPSAADAMGAASPLLPTSCSATHQPPPGSAILHVWAIGPNAPGKDRPRPRRRRHRRRRPSARMDAPEEVASASFASSG